MKKNPKWTKRELMELEENCKLYMICEAVFVHKCLGGQLMALMMSLKLFAQAQEKPSIITEQINELVEHYRQDVTKNFPGTRLIDFERPAAFLRTMIEVERQADATVVEADLSELTNAIEQRINGGN